MKAGRLRISEQKARYRLDTGLNNCKCGQSINNDICTPFSLVFSLWFEMRTEHSVVLLLSIPQFSGCHHKFGPDLNSFPRIPSLIYFRVLKPESGSFPGFSETLKFELAEFTRALLGRWWRSNVYYKAHFLKTKRGSRNTVQTLFILIIACYIKNSRCISSSFSRHFKPTRLRLELRGLARE